VWSFALNDSTGANPTPTSTGSLLFTAQDSGGKVQPITADMLAGKDPVTSNVWLFFGTGEYLSSTDLNSTATQTWYGIIAQACTTTSGGKKGGSGTTACAANAAGSRSNLTQRTITAQTAGGSGALPARSVSSEVVNSDGTTDMTGKDGWYMDLLAPIGAANAPVQQGERMIDPNEFQGSVLIGVTRIPLVTDVCSPSGSGWVMALDPFTGAAPSGDFFDVNNDGYVNSGDRVSGNVAAGVGFSSLPNAPIFVGGVMETSFDNGTMSSITTAGSVGTIKRVTWRELVNP
jgi:type IV pilus assembly protein PilY1